MREGGQVFLQKKITGNASVMGVFPALSLLEQVTPSAPWVTEPFPQLL